MDVISVQGGLEWNDANCRPGYRHRVAAVRCRLGARLLGRAVYELPSGETTWPYHYELGCAEWAIVISGNPTLRTPDGRRELSPGYVVVFPDGPGGAHEVANETDEPRRVLLSTEAPRNRPLPGQRRGRALVAGGLPIASPPLAESRFLGGRGLSRREPLLTASRRPRPARPR